MSIKVAINGFGRIGRSVFRILCDRDDMEVVAINDLFDNEALAYLLKYDTVMGIFQREVRTEGDLLFVDDRKVRMLETADARGLPWRSMGVDVVVEATGRFRTRESLKPHLDAGARRVLLTVPSKDAIDATRPSASRRDS
jgi:glyceraldehyde 3-phosphate dehydrogenase